MAHQQVGALEGFLAFLDFALVEWFGQMIGFMSPRGSLVSTSVSWRVSRNGLPYLRCSARVNIWLFSVSMIAFGCTQRFPMPYLFAALKLAIMDFFALLGLADTVRDGCVGGIGHGQSCHGHGPTECCLLIHWRRHGRTGLVSRCLHSWARQSDAAVERRGYVAGLQRAG